MSTLSDNLKYYRQCSGMTSREVSEKTGISQATYICWETGHRQPRNLDDLDKIAEVFGITKDILLIEQKERDTDRQKLLQTYDALSTESRKKLLDYAEDLMNSP